MLSAMAREQTSPPRRVDEIDWATWIPVDRATLLFVVRDGEILLIRKKRGLGAGKINGPGGRLEPGETPLDCAIRETQEELGVTPTGLALAGELRFQFSDGYSLHGHVFRADDCEGEAVESDEAIPLWTPVDAVPFDEMWEDDALWFPHLFARRHFAGRMLFDSATDRMLHAVFDEP